MLMESSKVQRKESIGKDAHSFRRKLVCSLFTFSYPQYILCELFCVFIVADCVSIAFRFMFPSVLVHKRFYSTRTMLELFI